MQHVFIFIYLLFLSSAVGANPVTHYKTDHHAQMRFFDKSQNSYVDARGIASEMEIDVHGNIGRARVIQYFANDTDQWQEGKYTYPLPPDAAVDKLVMMVGPHRILGFVAQREKARHVYEQAKRDGKAASLVEQHRENVFQTSVSNIPPRSLIAIEMAYQFNVSVEQNVFSMRIPMAITPRYDEFMPEEFLTLAAAQGDEDNNKVSRTLIERLVLFDFENGNNPFALRINIDPGFPVGTINSTSHDIVTKTDESGLITISPEQNILQGEQDFVLEWAAQDKAAPITFLHSETIGETVYTHLMVLPPHNTKDFIANHNVPRQVSMIIDISGSMAGPSIKQAKAALIEAVEDLEPQDYFSVISFESHTKWLFDHPVPATRDNQKRAIKWIANLEATGGTVMQPAIEKALSEPVIKDRLRQVVFITDGAIGYEGALAAYIRDHVGEARFFAVGIGAAPNSYMMELIARAGRGSATFIGDVKETETKMKDLFAKMKAPVLTDIVLNFPDIMDAEVIPDKIPDLLAGVPVSLAIKSDRPLGALSLEGMRGDRKWSKHIDGNDRRQAQGVGRIFARRKIAEIKFGDPAQNSAQSEAMITMLGIEHQIMSDYTSFVAVDEKSIRSAGEPLVFRRYDPNLPKGWTLADFKPRDAAQAYDQYLERLQDNDNSQNHLKHDINLPQTATNWMMQLLIGLALSMAGLMFLSIIRRRESDGTA